VRLESDRTGYYRLKSDYNEKTPRGIENKRGVKGFFYRQVHENMWVQLADLEKGEYRNIVKRGCAKKKRGSVGREKAEERLKEGLFTS